MHGINEQDQCGNLLSPLPFALEGYNSQGIDGCDRELFGGTWQDIASMNFTTDWNDFDLSPLGDAKDVLASFSETDKPHDDVIVEGGCPDLTGGLSVGSQSITTQSDCASASSSQNAEPDFFDVQWTELSCQPNTSASPDLRLCQDFLGKHEGLSADNTHNVVNEIGNRKRSRSVVSVEYEFERDRRYAHRHNRAGIGQKRMLACPYRKLDPHRHRDCLKYTLHRIKDVKQHINRRHKKLNIYCPRCCAAFRSQIERDEHTRNSDCEIGTKSMLEGVTKEQWEKLNKCSSRNVSLELQWFNMWDILFPGQERPRSAFSGSYIEEVVHLIRDCWNAKRSTLIYHAARDHGNITIDKDLLNRLMATLFNRLEEEVCSPSPSAELVSKPDDAGKQMQHRASKRSRKQ